MNARILTGNGGVVTGIYLDDLLLRDITSVVVGLSATGRPELSIRVQPDMLDFEVEGETPPESPWIGGE